MSGPSVDQFRPAAPLLGFAVPPLSRKPFFTRRPHRLGRNPLARFMVRALDQRRRPRASVDDTIWSIIQDDLPEMLRCLEAMQFE